jgi:hypothetical protein
MHVMILIFTICLLTAQAPTVVDQFAAAESITKIQFVSEVVTGKRPATDADVRALLVAAMKDPDTGVRVNAVGSVTAILTISSMTPPPVGQEWTVRLRSVAENLKPQLDAAADDPEPRVRTEALRGMLAEVVAAQYGGRGTGVPRALAIRLAAKFDSDPSPAVRAFILQALTTSGRSDDATVQEMARAVLLKGAVATEPAIVQAAASSVSLPPAVSSRPVPEPEALPLFVAQLKHSSAAVRIAVAQAIASFHEAARPYVPELKAALNVETDDIARKTIAGTIVVVSR